MYKVSFIVEHLTICVLPDTHLYYNYDCLLQAPASAKPAGGGMTIDLTEEEEPTPKQQVSNHRKLRFVGQYHT